MRYDMHKKRKRHFKKTNGLKLYLTVIFVIFLLILHVGLQVGILTLEERVREIKNDNELIDGEIKKLEIEVAGLRKGNRIKKIAREDLGMVIPDGAPEPLF